MDEYDLQPLLDTQQNQLNLLFSESDSIDTKALALLGTNVAILLFVAQAHIHAHNWLIHGLFLSIFILSLLFDVLATWPSNYIGAGIKLNEHPEYLGLERKALLEQLLSDTQSAIQHNGQLNKQRWQYCLGSTALTAIGLIMLFAIL